MGLLLGVVLGLGIWYASPLGLMWSLLIGLAAGILFHFMLTKNPTPSGSAGGGFFNGLGTFFRGLFRSVWGLIFGSVIFLGLLMALSRFLNVAPGKVTKSIVKQGWNPNNWTRPDGPTMIFVLCLILILIAVQQAATGRTAMAKRMVFLALGFSLFLLRLPNTAAKVLPPDTDGKPSWNALDNAMAKRLDESHGGILPAATTTIVDRVLGHTQGMDDNGVLPDTAHRANVYWLNGTKGGNNHSPESTRRSIRVVSYTTREVKPAKVGCTTSEPFPMVDGEVRHTIVGYDFRIYPKGGCVMAYPPNGEPFIDCPGKDVAGGAKTAYSAGPWRWKAITAANAPEGFPVGDVATGVATCE